MAERKSVAIIGVGGEFPNSPTLERYWENIINNVNTSRRPPEGRWLLSLDSVFDPQVGVADKVYSQKACFLEDETDYTRITGLELDPEFLQTLDPMFRLLLRVGQQTLADLQSNTIKRSNSGVIIGNLALPSEKSSQLARHLLGQAFVEKLSHHPLTICDQPVAAVNHYVAGLPASLLAKALGFQGTCFTVDAACASSLYAIKLAVDELISGRADTMLAGGLARPDSLYTQMGFSQLRALSPNGTCSPFDQAGNGLVVGEGCGLVLLKRTEDAIRDGDHIYAVIRGCGLSNDLEGNLLAPASEGQLRAMRSAYQHAGWSPTDVDLVECHATGTPVGDAVEFNSLKTLWSDHSWRPGQCVIGSVKANIGHLLTAAGAAAVIKTLLALKHQILPPMANFSNPAQGIELDGSPFKILHQAVRWETRANDQPRRAAVSAFGFGGINAHLLLEEWLPVKRTKRAVASHPAFKQKFEPLAIVGMASHFGPWDNLSKFRRRVLGDKQDVMPTRPQTWWGLEKTSWFADKGLQHIPFSGYFVPEVTARSGEFKIPPKELEEMLPRQLLMLKVATAALKDADISQEDFLFTGIYIGCGLDLNATNFSFRWGMEKYARIWAQELGLELDEYQLAEWVKELRNSCGPPLTANRTMGALGSVVASRIAKNFRIGGPSFTLSSEENSGLRALEVAAHSLQEGSINRAIVGAVDLAGDLRCVISRHEIYPYSPTGRIKPFDQQADGSLIGEGAAAVVLKRLVDAKQDGDRIYATIRGLGTSIQGQPESLTVQPKAYSQSLERACLRAKTKCTEISYIETEGCGIPSIDQLETGALSRFIGETTAGQRNCWIGSVKADIGYAGSAAGLASLIKTTFCLYHRILPPIRDSKDFYPERLADKPPWMVPHEPQYWLSDRASGPRRALVGAIGGDGSCSHIVLEEDNESDKRPLLPQISRPIGALNEGLFILSGDSNADLLSALKQLRQLAVNSPQLVMDDLACGWWNRGCYQADHQQRLCLVAEQHENLMAQLDYVGQALRSDPRKMIGRNGSLPISPFLRDRIFYSLEPLSSKGKLAFVFPGSGNHFPGMGAELSAHWPEIYRSQESSSRYLSSQYQPELFWQGQLDEALHRQHNALVISHVALCTAFHDLVTYFGIKPDMISGYSLGESAGLFSTRAWTDRDGMLERLQNSTLFTRDLAGECRAAQRIWGLAAEEKVDWLIGMVDLPGNQIKQYLQGKKQVYLLIINTYRESVVGGQRHHVEQLVKDLGCHFIPLQGVTTVHCEVTKAVANAYRQLHFFAVTPPQGIDFYSCALGKKYPLTSDNCADVILGQALETIDYPRVVEQLYKDGARIFLELGPGSSCSRMISSILAERPHKIRSICAPGQFASAQFLRLLASCLVEGVPVDIAKLYPKELSKGQNSTPQTTEIKTVIGGQSFSPRIVEKSNSAIKTNHSDTFLKATSRVLTGGKIAKEEKIQTFSNVKILAQFNDQASAQMRAHEAYLAFSKNMQAALSMTIQQQMSLLQQFSSSREPLDSESITVDSTLTSGILSGANQSLTTGRQSVAFDRAMCLEFATGSVAKMLGPDFAEVDRYPTRVRLPDEPLMLVDRILQVEGVPRSMTRGRVVTEHDVTGDRWYLDGGHIPTCIAVEAGQADLFLSGYLGIDFVSKGNAVYRLLDAVVTFHRSLPGVGETIHYDIRIEEFFRQDQTYLFRFNFEGTVNGEPLLSMRNGCAGFFSAEELAAGKGIVQTKLDLMPQAGKLPDDWRELIPLRIEAYNEAQVDALYAGCLSDCFGPDFAQLQLQQPYTLPGGQLKLVDRVIKLDPQGGRYGLGQIVAEMDIHPDSWFLTCHFVDDRVMPGTLMYECCMHTLRIYLLRMGWIGEEGETWCEPVAGVCSGLKCRGQVIESTKTVTYQVSIKELGYGPEPFAIADALMFADGHPIVEIPDMSVQLAGLNRDKVESQWRTVGAKLSEVPTRQILYDTDRITAFAIGNPSVAFGEPYRIFDHERKIARLPGPPYQFLDRIVAIDGEPWKLVEGVNVVAEYDVPADAWYFYAGRQTSMPFSILLEIGLQPCGWLAAYLGSALTSPVDLCFRNLDGHAVQSRSVTPDSGTLSIDVKITKIASSGGMIIQNYDFAVKDSRGPVYQGETVFGFFSRESLAQQVGIRGVLPYQPGTEELSRAENFSYPTKAPYPDTLLRMVDQIDLFIKDGGPHGLGFIRGTKIVNPQEWFFKAHFYQDPVCPGSLGLESFLQLLKVVAGQRWGTTENSVFETVALNERHRWNYRGQIIPGNKMITIEAVVTSIDDQNRLLKADGFLTVDGKIIYQMSDFSIKQRD